MLGKRLCCTQCECVTRKSGCCWFERVRLMLLFWCGGGSTAHSLREDESRIVVALFVVVFGRESQSYLLFGRVLLVGWS